MLSSVTRRPSVLALLAIFLGAFLRFHELGAVPPGLHYDFAANAIIANQIAFEGWREVFITAYTGKEALFFYTAGLLFKFVGSSIFTLQLTAAFYGVLGIAACYFAARELTWDDPDSAWIAALAAAVMSFTFMHLVWSRYGERATTEPFVQGLATGFLFRSLRLYELNREGATNAKEITTSTRAPFASPALFRGLRLSLLSELSKNPAANMILAGAFTGLAAYTYLAARLFPIPIAITLLAFLIGTFRRPLDHPTIRPFDYSTIRLLALYILAAAIVFAPLGWFFVQHPEAFLIRANQLTPKEGEGDLLLKGVTGALGMIFVSGEPYDRFNIPGRPIFGPFFGLFFLIGFIITLAKIIRPPRNIAEHPIGTQHATRGHLTTRPLDRLAYLFILTYTLTFLLPTALSVHDIFPSNVRSMGLLPVLTLFPALGIVATIRRLSSLRDRPAPLIIHHSSFIVLILGAITTYHSYFNLWATAPSLYYANDTDLANASRWINTLDTRPDSVYFSAIHYRHPTVAYLARDFESFRWFTSGDSLSIPTGPALYIFPHSAPPPEEWIDGWQPVATYPGPDGTPDFRAYINNSAPPLPDFIPTTGNFGNIVEITGYRIPEPGVVDVRLRVLNPPDRPDYRLVADLTDIAGYRWTQAFNDSYFSEQWQVGETILMRLKFQIETGTPPGNYQLLLAIYSASANTNLPAITSEGYSAAYAAVGPIPIPRADPLPIAQPILTLSGLNVVKLDPPPAQIRPGERLPFAIHWQAHSPVFNSQLLITKLNDITLESSAPVHDTYPFTQWLTGEIVIDRHNPRVPRDLAPGEYTVTVNGVEIGTITVIPIQRNFDPSTPSRSLISNYQSLFELVGYGLTPDSITLYWHTLDETDTDYTAFVHVLDANGQIIAQNDSQPRGGDYPTSMWAKGEYVADTIRIPTVGNSIEIGWYVAETGERLKTEEGDVVRITP